MRTDRLRLLDAIEQIELISSFSVRGREAFFNDLIVQSAVLLRLALLGEACRGVSSELREAHPEIPWPQIVGFRNVVIHEYFGLDLELVWVIGAEHVATLGAQLNSVVASFPGWLAGSLPGRLGDTLYNQSSERAGHLAHAQNRKSEEAQNDGPNERERHRRPHRATLAGHGQPAGLHRARRLQALRAANHLPALPFAPLRAPPRRTGAPDRRPG